MKNHAELLKTAEMALSALKNAQVNAKEKSYDEGLTLSAKLTEAVDALNANTLETTFRDCISKENPIAALCACHYWNKWQAKVKSGRMETRRTRLDIRAFIKWAEKNETPITNGAEVLNALEKASKVVAEYVRDTLQREKCMSIGAPKAAIEELIKLIGIEKVHARSVDVRWLVYATTKARELGELKIINGAALAPYIMDVFYIQLTGKKYDFAKAENK